MSRGLDRIVRLGLLATLSLGTVAEGAASAADKKKDAAPPLPPLAVRVSVIAPSADGPWRFRIDNDAAEAVRVPADVRLLTFDLETIDPKTNKVVKTACKLPAQLKQSAFPDPRQLLLDAGKSYTEQFDPRLFCFGKAGLALTGGTVVHARFGWDAPKNAKQIDAPFAAQGVSFPALAASAKSLVAPGMLLAFPPPAAPPPEAKEPPKDEPKKDDAKKDEPKKEEDKKIVDANAPRLELSVSPFSEAADPAHTSVTFTAKNVGQRAMQVLLRPRMVSLNIEGPLTDDGRGPPVATRCNALAPTRAFPREAYRSLAPGKSESMTVLINEICPTDVLRRPGVYRVSVGLAVNEAGLEAGVVAYTARIAAKDPAYVRLATGPEPFYLGAPLKPGAPVVTQGAPKDEPKKALKTR